MTEHRHPRISPSAAYRNVPLDPAWARISAEAEAVLADEPVLAEFVRDDVLQHGCLEQALCHRLARTLAARSVPECALRDICAAVYAADAAVGGAARADMEAVCQRDPATYRYLQPFLYLKGFLALQAHRIAHALWRDGRRDVAYFVQMRSSEVFGVDIHPAARVGPGLMIDHAHSIVIGETVEIGDNVTLLHSVTLGGTGKEGGDRHPKIGDNVMIGAGAIVLGNIRIGNHARIAAGSVVLRSVPSEKTVAGVPARIVGPDFPWLIDGAGI